MNKEEFSPTPHMACFPTYTEEGYLARIFTTSNFSVGQVLLSSLLKVFILFIRLYQSISWLWPKSCRFYPTCSNYAIEALKSFGAIKGSWITLQRIGRCHPFHTGGYDPVSVNLQRYFEEHRDEERTNLFVR